MLLCVVVSTSKQNIGLEYLAHSAHPQVEEEESGSEEAEEDAEEEEEVDAFPAGPEPAAEPEPEQGPAHHPTPLSLRIALYHSDAIVYWTSMKQNNTFVPFCVEFRKLLAPLSCLQLDTQLLQSGALSEVM